MDFDPRTENQLRRLCDRRNRVIRDILEETDGVLHVTELADRLVARDVNVVRTATYEEKLDTTCFELHHERLPKLAEVELVEPPVNSYPVGHPIEDRPAQRCQSKIQVTQ